MSAGKVEIGCFRVYPESYIQQMEKQGGGDGTSKGMIPQEKMQDFGLHAKKYYQLEHSFFKSRLDSQILESLWNEYWIQTLSSSPLLNNAQYLTKAIGNIATKMDLVVDSVTGGQKNKRHHGASGG